MDINTIFNYIQNSWYIYGLICAGIGVISWLRITLIKINKSLSLLNQLTEKFEPNSGSSIFDIITRIETKVNLFEFMHLAHLDVVNTPIFMSDSHGKYVWANRAFLTLTNSNLNEIIGTGWENNLDEEDRERVTHNWYQACEELRPYTMIYKITNNNNNNKMLVRCEATGKANLGYFGSVKEIKKIEV